ncbi:MAG: DUF6062 family protein [Defluviitaleaceae bacterium]|nr:DUF6062 family protein [Defluviitaleaceae bacterium]
MKEHIHTIPVIDALREPGHCPFCKIYDKLEADSIDFIMGPSLSYMTESVRDETNEAGFCEEHLRKLYAVQNRLGLALMLHTHFKYVQKNMESGKIADIGSGLFKKGETQAERTAKKITAFQNRCYICEKINGTFLRYMDTFFYLWPRDSNIKPLVKALPGFCLPHYAAMLSMAEKSLGKKHLDDFLGVVVPLQKAAMEQLEGDMDWFIQKFDYRNNDAPWKNSKDAINRTMAMLKGAIIE